MSRPSCLRALVGLNRSLGLRPRDPIDAFKRPRRRRRRRRSRFGADEDDTWEQWIQDRVDSSTRIVVSILTGPGAAITQRQAAVSAQARARQDAALARLGTQWRDLTGLMHETASEGFVESAKNIAVMRDAVAAAMAKLGEGGGAAFRAFMGFSPREAAGVGTLLFMLVAAGGLVLLLSPGAQLAIGAAGALPKGIGAGLAGYGKGAGIGVAKLGEGLGKGLPQIIRLRAGGG